MKRFKKILAFFLVLALCLSLVPAAAFADKPVYKIVAVGDSTCVGLGLDDFGMYKMRDCISSPIPEETLWYYFVYDKGFLDYGSKDAYPARLARYLAEKMPEADVQYTNLGISGIRADEILQILDPIYELDPAGEYTYNECITLLEPLCSLPLTGLGLRELFTEEIKSADLITLDCVMNSFTYYLGERMSALMSGDPELMEQYSQSPADLAAKLVPEAKQCIDRFAAGFKSAVRTVLPENIVTGAIDALTYCYMDFCTCFSLLVEKIRELNPDAKLLVGGAYNPLHDMKLEYMGLTLDAGPLLSSFFGLVNEYIAGLAPQRDEYSFINIPFDIETTRDVLRRADTVWDLPTVSLNRMIDVLFGDNHSLLATPLCTRARAEAVAQGIDISEYTSIWPDMMFGYYEDVRQNGASAAEMNKLIVGLFNKVFDLILGCMKMDTMDAQGALAGMNEDYHTVLLRYMDTPFEELSPAEQTEIFVSVCMKLREGMAVHFSADGCKEKFELAAQALEEPRSSGSYVGSLLDGVRENALAGLRSSLQDTLHKLFARIDLPALLSGLRDRIAQFFIMPIKPIK